MVAPDQSASTGGQADRRRSVRGRRTPLRIQPGSALGAVGRGWRGRSATTGGVAMTPRLPGPATEHARVIGSHRRFWGVLSCAVTLTMTGGGLAHANVPGP